MVAEAKKMALIKKIICGSILSGLFLLHPINAYAQPLPPQFVRENINQFMNKPLRIAAFKRGIEVMKQRPATDPTSWAFQSNIHGSADTSQPLWNQCQHRHWWFLAWHRAYLYYMEKMLQKAAAEPRLRIPYWNYTDPTSRSLPTPFLDSTSVLFSPSRNMTLPTDEVTPSAANTSVALSRVNFVGSDAELAFGGGQEAAPVQFPFENKAGSLERVPHNAIHTQVGGRMQNARLAALDPVFWLHHCNIDRLWEVWLQSGQGRTNPIDESFLNATFTLYNEDGVQVTHQVKDFLVDTRELGYYYDNPLPVGPVASVEPGLQDKLTFRQPLNLHEETERQHSLTLVADARLNSGEIQDAGAASTSVNGSTITTLAETHLTQPAKILMQPITVPIKTNLQLPQAKRLLSNTLTAEEADNRYLLVLDDIEFEKLPTNLYELYLNLPTANYTTLGQTKYYVGPLSFFESDIPNHHGHQAKRTETFDITDVVHALQREQSLDISQLTITIVPVGIIRKGKPTLPSNPVAIQLKSAKIVVIQKQKPQIQNMIKPSQEMKY
jgi:tyrosinase